MIFVNILSRSWQRTDLRLSSNDLSQRSLTNLGCSDKSSNNNSDDNSVTCMMSLVFILNRRLYEVLWLLHYLYLSIFLESLLVGAVLMLLWVILLFRLYIVCTFLCRIKVCNYDALVSFHFLNIFIWRSLLTVKNCNLSLCPFPRMIMSRRLLYYNFFSQKHLISVVRYS